MKAFSRLLCFLQECLYIENCALDAMGDSRNAPHDCCWRKLDDVARIIEDKLKLIFVHFIHQWNQ